MEAARTSERVVSAFCRHPIYDRLFSCLSPATLVIMGRVSHLTRDALQDFSSRAYNVNRLLSRFFRNPLAFRSLQARTATLISGSTALQLFDRTFYPESDLDLYVWPQHVLELGQTLQNEGYVFHPNSFQRADFSDAAQHGGSMYQREPSDLVQPQDQEHHQHYATQSIAEVWTFFKEEPGMPYDQDESWGKPSEVLKVQLILSITTPLGCVLSFHSTCVMNVISYDAAFSLYPYATFVQREALVIGADSRQAPALRKYGARGWKIIGSASPLVTHPSMSTGRRTLGSHFNVQDTRWIDDSNSWVIRLDTTGVSAPPPLSPSSTPLTVDPVWQNSWTLCAAEKEGAFPFLEEDKNTYGMIYLTAKAGVLKYQYMVAEDEYMRTLKPFFRSQGKLEFMKLPPGAPQNEANIRPEYWTWWDSVLPLFRENFSRMQKEKQEKAKEQRGELEQDVAMAMAMDVYF